MTDTLPLQPHGGAAALEHPAMTTSSGRGSGLLAGVRSGTWLDAQEFAPLRFAVDGLVPEGLSLLVGAPKIGKSWMLTGLALDVARGSLALGTIPVLARPVLYLALEDSDRRLQDRCRRLLPAGASIPAGFHYVTRVTPGDELPTVRAWLATVSDAALVIVDTLGRVLPAAHKGESAYQRDYRIGVELKGIADDHAGCSVLASHHDRKAAAEDFVDAVSGTHGLAGAADTVIVISRQRQDPHGMLKVTGRDVAEDQYAATFNPDANGWTLTGRDLASAASNAANARTTAGLGDRMADVVAYVNNHGSPIGAADVAAALDIEPDLARQYLRRATDAGRLRRSSRGRYTSVTSVTSTTDATPQRDTCDTPLTTGTIAPATQAALPPDDNPTLFANGILP